MECPRHQAVSCSIASWCGVPPEPAARAIISAVTKEERFFVRYAYFTGADQPYEKLKRALRAEVDEDAWSGLYSTRSRPYSPPTTEKVAIKVTDHYGDEVLKVFDALP